MTVIAQAVNDLHPGGRALPRSVASAHDSMYQVGGEGPAVSVLFK